MNKSDFENLKNSDIKIDVRLQNLYTTNNRVSNIQRVPRIIEIDSLATQLVRSQRLILKEFQK